MDKSHRPRPVRWGSWVEDAFCWCSKSIIPKGRVKAEPFHLVCFMISSVNWVKISQPKTSLVIVKTHTTGSQRDLEISLSEVLVSDFYLLQVIFPVLVGNDIQRKWLASSLVTSYASWSSWHLVIYLLDLNGSPSTRRPCPEHGFISTEGLRKTVIVWTAHEL